MLPYPYADTTKTANSITFKENGDGTITANDTAIGEARFVLGNNIAINNAAVISGCPANGSSTTYLIQIVQTENGVDKYYADTGNGQITMVEKVEVHHDRHYKVYFKNGQVISL